MHILIKFRTSRGDSREETISELRTTGDGKRMALSMQQVEVTTTTKIQRNRHKLSSRRIVVLRWFGGDENKESDTSEGMVTQKRNDAQKG